MLSGSLRDNAWWLLPVSLEFIFRSGSWWTGTALGSWGLLKGVTSLQEWLPGGQWLINFPACIAFVIVLAIFLEETVLTPSWTAKGSPTFFLRQIIVPALRGDVIGQVLALVLPAVHALLVASPAIVDVAITQPVTCTTADSALNETVNATCATATTFNVDLPASFAVAPLAWADRLSISLFSLAVVSPLILVHTGVLRPNVSIRILLSAAACFISGASFVACGILQVRPGSQYLPSLLYAALAWPFISAAVGVVTVAGVHGAVKLISLYNFLPTITDQWLPWLIAAVPSAVSWTAEWVAKKLNKGGSTQGQGQGVQRAGNNVPSSLSGFNDRGFITTSQPPGQVASTGTGTGSTSPSTSPGPVPAAVSLALRSAGHRIRIVAWISLFTETAVQVLATLLTITWARAACVHIARTIDAFEAPGPALWGLREHWPWRPFDTFQSTLVGAPALLLIALALFACMALLVQAQWREAGKLQGATRYDWRQARILHSSSPPRWSSAGLFSTGAAPEGDAERVRDQALSPLQLLHSLWTSPIDALLIPAATALWTAPDMEPNLLLQTLLNKGHGHYRWTPPPPNACIAPQPRAVMLEQEVVLEVPRTDEASVQLRAAALQAAKNAADGSGSGAGLAQAARSPVASASARGMEPFTLRIAALDPDMHLQRQVEAIRGIPTLARSLLGDLACAGSYGLANDTGIMQSSIDVSVQRVLGTGTYGHIPDPGCDQVVVRVTVYWQAVYPLLRALLAALRNVLSRDVCKSIHISGVATGVRTGTGTGTGGNALELAQLASDLQAAFREQAGIAIREVKLLLQPSNGSPGPGPGPAAPPAGRGGPAAIAPPADLQAKVLSLLAFPVKALLGAWDTPLVTASIHTRTDRIPNPLDPLNPFTLRRSLEGCEVRAELGSLLLSLTVSERLEALERAWALLSQSPLPDAVLPDLSASGLASELGGAQQTRTQGQGQGGGAAGAASRDFTPAAQSRINNGSKLLNCFAAARQCLSALSILSQDGSIMMAVPTVHGHLTSALASLAIATGGADEAASGSLVEKHPRLQRLESVGAGADPRVRAWLLASPLLATAVEALVAARHTLNVMAQRGDWADVEGGFAPGTDVTAQRLWHIYARIALEALAKLVGTSLAATAAQAPVPSATEAFLKPHDLSAVSADQVALGSQTPGASSLLPSPRSATPLSPTSLLLSSPSSLTAAAASGACLPDALLQQMRLVDVVSLLGPGLHLATSLLSAPKPDVSAPGLTQSAQGEGSAARQQAVESGLLAAFPGDLALTPSDTEMRTASFLVECAAGGSAAQPGPSPSAPSPSPSSVTSPSTVFPFFPIWVSAPPIPAIEPKCKEAVGGPAMREALRTVERRTGKAGVDKAVWHVYDDRSTDGTAAAKPASGGSTASAVTGGGGAAGGSFAASALSPALIRRLRWLRAVYSWLDAPGIASKPDAELAGLLIGLVFKADAPNGLSPTSASAAPTPLHPLLQDVPAAASIYTTEAGERGLFGKGDPFAPPSSMEVRTSALDVTKARDAVKQARESDNPDALLACEAKLASMLAKGRELLRKEREQARTAAGAGGAAGGAPIANGHVGASESKEDAAAAAAAANGQANGASADDAEPSEEDLFQATGKALAIESRAASTQASAAALITALRSVLAQADESFMFAKYLKPLMPKPAPASGSAGAAAATAGAGQGGAQSRVATIVLPVPIPALAAPPVVQQATPALAVIVPPAPPADETEGASASAASVSVPADDDNPTEHPAAERPLVPAPAPTTQPASAPALPSSAPWNPEELPADFVEQLREAAARAARRRGDESSVGAVVDIEPQRRKVVEARSRLAAFVRRHGSSIVAAVTRLNDYSLGGRAGGLGTSGPEACTAPLTATCCASVSLEAARVGDHLMGAQYEVEVAGGDAYRTPAYVERLEATASTPIGSGERIAAALSAYEGIVLQAVASIATAAEQERIAAEEAARRAAPAPAPAPEEAKPVAKVRRVQDEDSDDEDSRRRASVASKRHTGSAAVTTPAATTAAAPSAALPVQTPADGVQDAESAAKLLATLLPIHFDRTFATITQAAPGNPQHLYRCTEALARGTPAPLGAGNSAASAVPVAYAHADPFYAYEETAALPLAWDQRLNCTDSGLTHDQRLAGLRAMPVACALSRLQRLRNAYGAVHSLLTRLFDSETHRCAGLAFPIVDLIKALEDHFLLPISRIAAPEGIPASSSLSPDPTRVYDRYVATAVAICASPDPTRPAALPIHDVAAFIFQVRAKALWAVPLALRKPLTEAAGHIPTALRAMGEAPAALPLTGLPLTEVQRYTTLIQSRNVDGQMEYATHATDAVGALVESLRACKAPAAAAAESAGAAESLVYGAMVDVDCTAVRPLRTNLPEGSSLEEAKACYDAQDGADVMNVSTLMYASGGRAAVRTASGCSAGTGVELISSSGRVRLLLRAVREAAEQVQLAQSTVKVLGGGSLSGAANSSASRGR